MDYSLEQQAAISRGAVGKTVHALTHEDDAGGYWVMTFSDGSEFSFRFMAELVS